MEKTTETTLVVLTEPFIRQPAGQVFELSAATGVSGWDPDERVREKQYFGDKRIWWLPDAGHGAGAELPVNSTRLCPPEVFSGVDITTGPCRVTGSFCSSSDGQPASPTDLKYNCNLKEINGLPAQGVIFTLDQTPDSITLKDVLRKEPLHNFSITGSEVFLDFSGFRPGFYEVTVLMPDSFFHQIKVFKSFPLLVFFEGNSPRYTVQPTLY